MLAFVFAQGLGNSRGEQDGAGHGGDGHEGVGGVDEHDHVVVGGGGTEDEGQRYCVNLALALPVSAAAGMISGMVGVGGGILKVPMMVLLFGVPMDIAIGSSAFMIGLTAAGGFAGHVAGGHWDWRSSLVLGMVVFAGGQIGSRLSLGLDKKKLKRAFGWFLLVIAVVMAVKAWA
jgi:uncharacterized protein